MRTYPLKAILEGYKITSGDLAKATGISLHQTSKIVNGLIATMPAELESFLARMGINVLLLKNDCDKWRREYQEELIKKIKSR